MTSLRAIVWLTAFFVGFVSVPARAETLKAQCVDANTKAQSLRRDGKLADARAELRFCSQQKCPGLVSADCVKRLDELETAQPTVVFEAADTSGHELNDVSVSMDGKPLVDKLTGGAVEVDLGEHVLRFTLEGRPAVEQKLVFREGEKARHVRVTFESEPGSSPTAALPLVAGAAPEDASAGSSPPSVDGSPASSGHKGSTQRTVGFVVGGVGVAGLAVGGVFGILAIKDKGRQTDNCASKTACPDYDTAVGAHDDAKTHGTISTVSFIVGGVATAAGLVLVLTAPKHSALSALGLYPTAGRDGAGLGMSGKF